jgi:hypothetical protein
MIVNHEFERLWKGAVVAYLRYCPRIWLGAVGKTMKETVRIAGFYVEIRSRDIPNIK